MPHVEAVVPAVLDQADKRSGVLAEAGCEYARPPRRWQQKRMESSPAGRFDHRPAIKEPVILEPFDPSLGVTPTWEEELFDLITIEAVRIAMSLAVRARTSSVVSCWVRRPLALLG